MSDQAANDGAASSDSQDDYRTTSLYSAADAPFSFYKRMAAWLTLLYDRKVYLKDKVEGFQAVGPTVNLPNSTMRSRKANSGNR
jgi:hypothetical protein